MNEKRWQDYVTTFVGIWVLFSPEIIHYFFPALVFTSAIAWSYGFVGLALIVMGARAVDVHQLWEEWVDVILGLWLIASPWIIGFANVTALSWNSVISGAVVIVLASWVLVTSRGRVRRPN